MKEDKCVICEKEGYGIIIRGKLICNTCEEKVITCDVKSDFYEFYKNKLKEKIYIN